MAYICRQSIGVVEKEIREDLQLSLETMGFIMGSFFFAYALAQIPSGWLGKKLGSRVGITLFAITWSAATGLLYFATGAPLLLLSRVASGLAQAGLFPAAAMTIRRWFPETGRAAASGALSASMSVGNALAAAMTGILVVRIGWRMTFVSYSLLSFIFAAACYAVIRNQPEGSSGTKSAKQQRLADYADSKNTVSDSHQAWRIFFRPATWWICGQQACRAAGQIFFGSWFATYLKETRGVELQTAGLLTSLPLVGLIIGALVGGTISDLILMLTGSLRLARSGVAFTSMILCALFVFIAYGIEDSTWAVLVISLGTFCAAVGGPCAYTVTMDMGGRHTVILFATMNMMGNLGAFAFIQCVPTLVKWSNWNDVLILFGALYVGAALFWLLINPQGNILPQTSLREDS